MDLIQKSTAMPVFVFDGLPTGIGSMPFRHPDNAVDLVFSHMPEIPHWPQLPQRGKSEYFIFQFMQILLDLGLIMIRPGKATHAPGTQPPECMVPPEPGVLETPSPVESCLMTGPKNGWGSPAHDIAPAEPSPFGNAVYFPADQADWPSRLTSFYERLLAIEDGDTEKLEAFATPEKSAVGLFAFIEHVLKKKPKSIRFVKGQIVGPLTAGFQLRDPRGCMAYYDDQLRDLIVRSLALNARWQARTLSTPGYPVILFIDEPAIGACGSCHYITLTREMIIEDINTIASAIHGEHALVGIHVCASGDWSIAFACELDIVNLDAFGFGESLLCFVPQMKAFLKRGGIMAWGIVPTTDRAFGETSETLFRRLEMLWKSLARQGIDSEFLAHRSLVTPACGTGLLSPKLSHRIYELTRQVSETLAERCTR